MIIKNIGNSLRRQDWLTLFFELVVVVAGLFLAFQVDRWWEARGARETERQYVVRLMEDISQDVENLRFAIELAEIRKDFSELLMKASANPAVAEEQPALFFAALVQACYTFTPALISHTYEDLQATGNMQLIRSEPVKGAIHEYYGFDRGQRQFMTINFMTEFRFFELSAGILSHAQYRWVEDQWNVVTAKDLDSVRAALPDPAGVQQAIELFQTRRELHDWLPKTWAVQRDLLWTHRARIERAERAFEILRAHGAGD